eukprot:PhF_6_TR5625/c1_g2_i1/m.8165
MATCNATRRRCFGDLPVRPTNPCKALTRPDPHVNFNEEVCECELETTSASKGDAEYVSRGGVQFEGSWSESQPTRVVWEYGSIIGSDTCGVRDDGAGGCSERGLECVAGMENVCSVFKNRNESGCGVAPYEMRCVFLFVSPIKKSK